MESITTLGGRDEAELEELHAVPLTRLINTAAKTLCATFPYPTKAEPSPVAGTSEYGGRLLGIVAPLPLSTLATSLAGLFGLGLPAEVADKHSQRLVCLDVYFEQ